jgi:hypothetical protein
MIRLGASSLDMTNMSKYDVFSSRLQLLIIMAKAYLNDYPLGKHRREAALKNVKEVFYLSLGIASESADWPGHIMNFQPGDEQRQKTNFEHVIQQRVQLLTVMATACFEGRHVGGFQKKAMEDNISFLGEALTLNSRVSEIEFLKVA